MKIVASDYDGTLRVNDVVLEDDLKYIHDFREAGNHFGIVTGRSMESIREELAKTGMEFDFIIANNGGVIFNKDFEELQTLRMDLRVAKDIVEYIQGQDCASYVINDGYHRHKYVVNREQVDYKYGGIEEDTQEEDLIAKGKVAQIVISLESDELAHSIANHINEQYCEYAIAYVNVHCVDIVPVSVSKANGIKFMENYQGYRHEDIIAIGDSYNDLPMIDAYYGCSVSHAKDEIKAHAKNVYDHVGDLLKAILEQ